MDSYLVKGQSRFAGTLLQSLSWVNSASLRQQGNSVSFLALPGTYAAGQKLPLTTGGFLAIGAESRLTESKRTLNRMHAVN